MHPAGARSDALVLAERSRCARPNMAAGWFPHQIWRGQRLAAA